MTILITSMLAPPSTLLEQAIKTGDLEDLEAWFIQQKGTGYSFQTIVDFVAEQRKTSKTKRASSGKSKARKVTN